MFYLIGLIESNQMSISKCIFEYNATADMKIELLNIIGETSQKKIIFPDYISMGLNTYEITELHTSTFKGTNFTEIILSDTITTLHKSVFSHCPHLYMVDMSRTKIKSIPYGCFEKSSNLSSVLFPPKTLTHIDQHAFKECGLKEIHLPDSVSDLLPRCFEKTNFIEFTLPKNTTTIPSHCFYKSKINICNTHDQLTSIGQSAFSGTKLSGFNFTSMINEIKKGAFSKTNLEIVDLSNLDNLVILMPNTFSLCKKLNTVILPPQIRSIGSFTFAITSLAQINFPNSLKIIDSFAFCETKIKIVNLPETVSYLGEGCFEDCLFLESLSIPGVTEVGAYFIANCTSLSNIEIPEYFINFSSKAFSRSSIINFIPKSDFILGEKVFSECNILETADLAHLKSNILPFGTFQNCFNLKKVQLPRDLEIIGNYSFARCTVLQSISSFDTITEIGSWAFASAGSVLLTFSVPHTISIGESAFADSSVLTAGLSNMDIYRIPDDCFRGCHNQAIFKVPQSTQEIGDRAFFGAAFQQLVMPLSLTSAGKESFALSMVTAGVFFSARFSDLGESSFENSSVPFVDLSATLLRVVPARCFLGCRLLQTLLLPDSLERIGDGAVALCGVASVGLGERVESIGAGCFEGSALKEVDLSDTRVTVLSESSFAGCGALSSVVLPLGLKEVGAFAFAQTAVKSLKLPATVAVLRRCAFWSMPLLVNIDMNASRVSVIRGLTFFNCSRLVRVWLPHALDELDADAFRGCGAIESVVYCGAQRLPNVVFGGNVSVFVKRDYPFARLSGSLVARSDVCAPLKMQAVRDKHSIEVTPQTAVALGVIFAVLCLTAFTVASLLKKRNSIMDGTPLILKEFGSDDDYL